MNTLLLLGSLAGMMLPQEAYDPARLRLTMKEESPKITEGQLDYIIDTLDDALRQASDLDAQLYAQLRENLLATLGGLRATGWFEPDGLADPVLRREIVQDRSAFYERLVHYPYLQDYEPTIQDQMTWLADTYRDTVRAHFPDLPEAWMTRAGEGLRTRMENYKGFHTIHFKRPLTTDELLAIEANLLNRAAIAQHKARDREFDDRDEFINFINQEAGGAVVDDVEETMRPSPDPDEFRAEQEYQAYLDELDAAEAGPDHPDPGMSKMPKFHSVRLHPRRQRTGDQRKSQEEEPERGTLQGLAVGAFGGVILTLLAVIVVWRVRR